MTTLENIKSKVTHIDIDELIKRLEFELKIRECIQTETSECIKTENDECIQFEDVDVKQLLQYSMYDTLLIILDITHLKKINEALYSIWVNMIKDYWYLNKYDVLLESLKQNETKGENNEDLEVSSIKAGDVQVNFSQKSNLVDINGTYFSTGKIDFDKNILVEKYKKDLYRHRKLRWG